MNKKFKHVKTLGCSFLVLFISGCASLNLDESENSDYASDLKSSVIICADHHDSDLVQKNHSFYVIDAKELSYLIVVSSTSLSQPNQFSSFCHIDKPDLSLVYANGVKPFLKGDKQSEGYEKRYSGVFADKARISRASVFKYKLINGIWRYIESRKVLGS